MTKKNVQAEPAKSNKEIVKSKHSKAQCIKSKSGGYHICLKNKYDIKPIHSGFCANESGAWKKAAHSML